MRGTLRLFPTIAKERYTGPGTMHLLPYQPRRGAIFVASPPRYQVSSVGAAWVWPAASRRLNPAPPAQPGALAQHSPRIPHLRSWPGVSRAAPLQICHSYGANPASRGGRYRHHFPMLGRIADLGPVGQYSSRK
jgi:hypothetical protein